MPIEWSKTIETGIGAIDMDHKQIIEFVNLIDAAPAAYYSRIMSQSVVETLKALIKHHYDREEELMFSIDYPNTNSHIAAHSVMLSYLDTATSKLKETENIEQMVNFISTWIVDHIKNEDSVLALFIRKKRVVNAERLKASLPKR